MAKGGSWGFCNRLKLFNLSQRQRDGSLHHLMAGDVPRFSVDFHFQCLFSSANAVNSDNEHIYMHGVLQFKVKAKIPYKVFYVMPCGKHSQTCGRRVTEVV